MVKGMTSEEKRLLTRLGTKNVSQFLDTMNQNNKPRKSKMTTLGKGKDDLSSPRSRTRSRERSASPSEITQANKKHKSVILDSAGHGSADQSDRCSDSDESDMEYESGTKKQANRKKTYRKKTQQPLREGEILIKIQNKNNESPISACKPGSVSIIKTTLSSLGVAEMQDMGYVQINSKEKWSTMTLMATGPGLRTETTINKLEKGPLDLTEMQGNTQALWTLTKLNKASTGLIKNINNEENIHELEAYIKSANPEVKSIRRLGKSWNVAVQFVDSEQPSYLDTPFGRRRVMEYVRGPAQCMKCFEFGHTTSRCEQETDRCAKCGKNGHKFENCENTQKCALCDSDGHNAWSRECPKRVEMNDLKNIEITRARKWQQKQNARENAGTFVYDHNDFPNLNTNTANADATGGSGRSDGTNNMSNHMDLMKKMVDDVRVEFQTQLQSLTETISSLVSTVNTCMKTLQTTLTSLGETCQQVLTHTHTEKADSATNYHALTTTLEKVRYELVCMNKMIVGQSNSTPTTPNRKNIHK